MSKHSFYVTISRMTESEPKHLPEPLFTKDNLEVYPLTAVARHVDFSPERIHQLRRENTIRAVKPAKEWFISLEDVIKYQESPKKKPGPKPKS